MSEVSKLKDAYDQASNTLVDICDTVLNSVVEGLVLPVEETCDTFRDAVETLYEVHLDARHAAGEDADAEIKPFNDYLKIVREQEEKSAQRRHILEEFASVTSDSAVYQDAIAPYVEAAKKLLDSPGIIMEAQTAGARLFLEAIRMPNIDTPEGEALFEKLEDFYPSMAIHRGLNFRAYTFPAWEAHKREAAPEAPEQPTAQAQPGAASAPQAEVQNAPAKEPVKAHSEPIAKEEPPARKSAGEQASKPPQSAQEPAPEKKAPQKPAPEKMAPQKAAVQAPAAQQATKEANVQDKTARKEHEEVKSAQTAAAANAPALAGQAASSAASADLHTKTAIAEAIREDEQTLETDIAHDELAVAEADKMLDPSRYMQARKPIPAVNKTPEQYLEDMVRVPLAKFIIPWFTHLSPMTTLQVVNYAVFCLGRDFHILGTQTVITSLNLLTDMGYLAAFDIEGLKNGEAAYCLTSNCHALLQLDEVRNSDIWKWQLGDQALVTAGTVEIEPFMLRLHYTAPLAFYFSWLSQTCAADAKQLWERMMNSIKWRDSHFGLGILWKGSIVGCTYQQDGEEPMADGNVLLLPTDPQAYAEMLTSDPTPTFIPQTIPENGSLYYIGGSVFMWDGANWLRESEVGDPQKLTDVAKVQSALIKKGVLPRIRKKKDKKTEESEEHATEKAPEAELDMHKAKDLLLKPAQPVKRPKRDQIGFATDVKNTPMARSILPLLSTYGALTETSIRMFGPLSDPEAFYNSNERTIHSALDKMVSKGLIASYDRVPPPGIGTKKTAGLTYCLTPYAANYMRDPDEVEDIHFWTRSYPNLPIVGGGNIMDLAFDVTELQGLALAYYLDWAYSTDAFLDFDYLLEEVQWDGAHYRVLVPWKDQYIQAMLLGAPYVAVPPDTNILFLDNENQHMSMNCALHIRGWADDIDSFSDADTLAPAPPPPKGKGVQFFALTNQQLFRWVRNRWIKPEDDGSKTLAVKKSTVSFALDEQNSRTLASPAYFDENHFELEYLDRQYDLYRRIDRTLDRMHEPLDLDEAEGLEALLSSGFSEEEADEEGTGSGDIIHPNRRLGDGKGTKSAKFIAETEGIWASGVILPLLVRMGPMTQQSILELGSRVGYFKIDDKTSRALRDSLEELEAVDIVAQYRLPDGRRAYLITPYGWSGLKLKAVRESSMQGQLYGQPELIAAEDMQLSTLRQFLDTNEMFLLYLPWATRMLDLQPERLSFQATMDRVEGFFSIPVQWNGLRIICRLQSLHDELTPGQDTLIVQKDDSSLLNSAENHPRNEPVHAQLFCLRGKKMYRWSGERWVTEKQDRKAEQALEEQRAAAKREAEKLAAKQAPKPAPAPAPKPVVKERPVVKPKEEAPKPAPIPKDPLDEMKARSLAQKLLEEGTTPDEYAMYRRLVDKLVGEDIAIAQGDRVENSLTQALTLAKALSLYGKDYVPDYQRLVFGTDSRIEPHRYQGSQIRALFDNDDAQPALKLMTMLRAMFAPDTAYDYALRDYAHELLDTFELQFPELEELKALYGILLDVVDTSSAGYSAKVIRSFATEDTRKKMLAQIETDAGSLVEMPRVKSGLKAMPGMLTQSFGPTSDLSKCMAIIRDDTRAQRQFVQQVFNEFADEDGQWSEQKIAEFHDKNWLKAVEKINGPRTLFGFLLEKLHGHVKNRVDVMARWLELTDTEDATSGKLVWSRRDQALDEMTRVLPLLDGLAPYDRAILKHGIERLRSRLDGNLATSTDDFADLLRTGYISLDDSQNLPVMDRDLPVYKYYEPWRNALRHIAAKPEGLLRVLAHISEDPNSHMYDNFGQAIDICEYLAGRVDSPPSATQYREDEEIGRRAADASVEEFVDGLESASAYGRITAIEKQYVHSALYKEDGSDSDMLELFDTTNNYGCLREFLAALKKDMDEKTAGRHEELQFAVEERRENIKPEGEFLLAEATRQIDARNYSLAEEYINRYDTNATAKVTVDSENLFGEFASDYSHLYQACMKQKGSNLGKFGPRIVEETFRKGGGHMTKEAVAERVDDGKGLLHAMPPDAVGATRDRVMTMMRELGLSPASAKQVSSSSMGGGHVHYSVKLHPVKADLDTYAHPIASMRTLLGDSMDVVCLFGRRQPNDIMRTLRDMKLPGTTLVLYGGAMDLAGRRQLAELLHSDTHGVPSFLFVDWVLLLFLAAQVESRRQAGLLACTMPYTTSFQPFVTDGPVPDEMFVGRLDDLAQILDPNGPWLVYGSPKVGKTALLEKAASLVQQPEAKKYGAYISGADLDAGSFASAVIQGLATAGLKGRPLKTVSELAGALKTSHKKGVYAQISLFVDDANALLESLKESKDLEVLRELCSATDGAVKCVFAGIPDIRGGGEGLSAVSRDEKDILTLAPLSEADALNLLWTPLKYLGYDLDLDTVLHLLISTNYYPGLVQYIGHKLAENIASGYKADDRQYSANENPPYPLSPKKLGEIISESELGERLRKALGADERYLMLARCVAYLTWEYPTRSDTGYPVSEIMDYADLLEIQGLPAADDLAVEQLLDVMVDMRILVKPADGLYRLRQQKLRDIIGTREQIEDEIALAQSE